MFQPSGLAIIRSATCSEHADELKLCKIYILFHLLPEISFPGCAVTLCTYDCKSFSITSYEDSEGR